jgi:hypothetical protein
MVSSRNDQRGPEEDRKGVGCMGKMVYSRNVPQEQGETGWMVLLEWHLPGMIHREWGEIMKYG